MNIMKGIMPLLIPFIIVELCLVITALVHIFKHNNYRFGNRIMWILVVLLIQVAGPILYFVVGRGDMD